MPLSEGDGIRVVRGQYRGMEGRFVRRTGLMSSVVALEGDNEQFRTLRNTSIEPHALPPQAARARRSSGSSIVIDREVLQQMLDDVQRISEELNSLKLRLREALN